ncbi:MAG: SMC-Scp complex subunit ScpB [Mycoplasmataceae bacterium]|jgi:segregation and condensation protein B|nr:SMC-Scp complex subunit ScpB [Mycoplasmataceae bacterium]
MNKHGIIEALLYIYGKEGCAATDLRRILNIESAELTTLINEINTNYKNNENCPFIINNYGNTYYLLTKPELKSVIEQLNIVKKNKNPLSKSLLEVLTIIAYNPNCTSSKIFEIRDVDPGAALDKLEKLGLITNDGRADAPGCPYIYNVTNKFFNLIGVKNFGSLPKIDGSFEVDESDADFFDSNRNEKD